MISSAAAHWLSQDCRSAKGSDHRIRFQRLSQPEVEDDVVTGYPDVVECAAVGAGYQEWY